MLKVALAQINPTVGDIAGNAALILRAAREAHVAGARLLVTPELALCGYPPEDLLLRPAFIAACDEALLQLARDLAPLDGMAVVVGHPHQEQGDVRTRSTRVPQRLNAASVLRGGVIEARYFKRELPNYQVFDERRYFASGRDAWRDAEVAEVSEPSAPGAGDSATPGAHFQSLRGAGPVVFELQGLRVGLLICEDAWFDEPAQLAVQAGAQVLCVLNASPFHLDKAGEREERMAQRARAVDRPLLYAHLSGAQDEVVFDGASFAVDRDGTLAMRAASFEEGLAYVDIEPAADGAPRISGVIKPLPGLEEQAWRALVIGVRDYLGKNGFPGAIIGLSGGVDSALVLAVAVEALGADRVRAVMMPSPYTADISWIDAREMAEGLGVQYDEISITPTFDAFRQSLAPQFTGLPEDTTEENIQARIRGTLLMALSNKSGRIVLTTGNKSEMATGYCTLYGDMAGGFAVIKDVAKTLVWRLCRWRNARPDPLTGAVRAVIPERIISRPPSAELRPDQLDQDSLPPYEVLDAILSRYMEEDESVDEIVAAGFDRATVERVARLIKINEYKRRQSPVGIRITHRSFGKDWRYPITSRFRA